LGEIDEQEIWFWLSDEQWARIEPHLPTDVARRRTGANDRRVIRRGLCHVPQVWACRWCDCPEALWSAADDDL